MHAGKIAQQNALGALQFVVADVIGEGAERLEHLARDGLGIDVFLAHPRVAVGEGVEGGIDEFAVGLGIFQVLQFFDALFVGDAFHLHLGHLAVFQAVELFAQDDVRVLDDGFHHGQQNEGVIRLLGIHEGNGLQQIERERLIHGEILLQLHIHAQVGAIGGLGNELHHFAIQQ